MANPYVSEIRMFGTNFAPKGWALCNGQLLSIQQNTALFSLIGTLYGGNGTTTFGLPDLQGRVPIHQGNGAGLSPYVVGQRGGVESDTLTVGQMPAHNHLVNATHDTSSHDRPGEKYLGMASTPIYVTTPVSMETMSPSMISIAGGSQPLSIVQPYLAITLCIALVGIFPSRS
jgi:microcystin-dependent protein